MALPHREWTEFDHRTIERLSINNSEGPEASKWTTGHYEYSKIGNWTETGGVPGAYWSWKTIVRPSTSNFALVQSMDKVIDFGVTLSAAIDIDDCGATNFDIWWESLDCTITPHRWESDSVSGRFYDGINQWSSYPYYMGCCNGDGFYFLAAAYPITDITRWMGSHNFGSTCGYSESENFFRNGAVFYLDIAGTGCSSPLNPPDELSGHIEVSEITVNYFNPVVNSISRRWMPTAGGVRIVLSGLGFNQSDAEITSMTRSAQNTPGAFDSIIDYIDFIGLQGQGTYRLTRGLGDFYCESDTKIIIPSIIALPQGTYEIKLIKDNILIVNTDAECYVGDFKATPEGLVEEGDGRFHFLVSDEYKEPKPPMLFTSWEWKLGCVDEEDREHIITEYYAPIDVRSPEIFWDGRILGVSSITRSIDDFNGMFQVSDMEVELASQDMHFQERIALGHSKNQAVSLSFGWTTEPASWLSSVFRGICDDYSLKATTFTGHIKDISQKYFRKILPRYIATQEDYPDIFPDHIGHPVPELLGEHSWTEGENPGAIEAIYTDTINYQYLCSAGALTSVPEVYSAGVLVNPANYAIITVDGRTYIDFIADQGNNKITFNCTGYSLPGWNSGNGYVQNPAYILAYVLVYFLEVPLGNIDAAALAELVAYYEDNGWGEIGRLALTSTTNPTTVFQELLFSFGVKMWPALDGNFKFARKDLIDFEAETMIFAQIDLIDEPEKQFNLRDAINNIKSKWDFYPASNTWKSATEIINEVAETCYDEAMEAPQNWDYPWITSSEFAAIRINEDLARLAYGNRVITFDLPIEFITKLDIFDNFILQDPHGISVGGAGDPGWYYYVISLTYDFQNMTIRVIGADLQWLAGQCFIIGRCTDIVNDYADTSSWMKVFGYIGNCDTDLLPGGAPLKKICPCD